MRTIKYTQVVPAKVIAIVLMPTYGTPSWNPIMKSKHKLPLKIVKESHENKEQFMSRAAEKFVIIEKDFVMLERRFAGLWIQSHYGKAKHIKHNYIQPVRKKS